MENQVQPPSMFEMDRTQVKALQQAAQQRQPFRVQVGSKGLEHGHFGGYQTRMKAAVTEGGLTPNLLPPIQQPGQRGFYGIPYELTRVVNLLAYRRMSGTRRRLFQPRLATARRPATPRRERPSRT